MARKLKLSKTDKRLETLAAKTAAQKEALLEQLAKYPIIQVACERAGVGRSTYYDWFKQDPKFAKYAREALDKGAGFVNDMAESMLIKNVQNGNNTSIIFWLKNHHKGYNDRVIHDHRYSIWAGEENDGSIFTPKEIDAMMAAFHNVGYANIIKMNSRGPSIDIDAVKRELPGAEKIIASHEARWEEENEKHAQGADEALGFSEEKLAAKSAERKEKIETGKKERGVNLKEFFRKREALEKAEIAQVAKELGTGLKMKPGVNLKEFFEKREKKLKKSRKREV